MLDMRQDNVRDFWHEHFIVKILSGWFGFLL